MQKLSYIGVILLVFASCKTAIEPFNKKNISNREFKETFQITEHTPKAKSNVKYYWYKSRNVQATQSDYAGELLDGTYTKFYHSNQLAQKGNFNKGKKTGLWKTWYENGQLASAMKYKNGRLAGRSVSLDSTGNIVSVGRYASGKRSGRWIFPQQGDTIRYHKGEVKVVEEKDSLNPGFFRKLFKKKAKDSTNQKEKRNFFKRFVSKKEENPASKNVNKKTTRVSQKKNKKQTNTKKKKVQGKKKKVTEKKEPNFFQRLFGKKKKNNTT
ncbi:hypothetical protein U6A24_11240 [Aquimarina gracilis]|uniref:MORN repeat protein n=1 Tax=Aquimarina gracilis TaxID=874422 RepID=A0ABU5ZVY7_9FLAO|nr:hypothetical protein [Aquimarina gracilis]MEB3346040.1 hypothetical protein [Aquimarina gracilis]